MTANTLHNILILNILDIVVDAGNALARLKAKQKMRDEPDTGGGKEILSHKLIGIGMESNQAGKRSEKVE
jgi:hypothetical protein